MALVKRSPKMTANWALAINLPPRAATAIGITAIKKILRVSRNVDRVVKIDCNPTPNGGISPRSSELLQRIAEVLDVPVASFLQLDSSHLFYSDDKSSWYIASDPRGFVVLHRKSTLVENYDTIESLPDFLKHNIDSHQHKALIDLFGQLLMRYVRA